MFGGHRLPTARASSKFCFSRTAAAEPFDAPEYCFEIKYDGVRALAAVDETGWRVWGRDRGDYTARYR